MTSFQLLQVAKDARLEGRSAEAAAVMAEAEENLGEWKRRTYHVGVSRWAARHLAYTSLSRREINAKINGDHWRQWCSEPQVLSFASASDALNFHVGMRIVRGTSDREDAIPYEVTAIDAERGHITVKRRSR